MESISGLTSTAGLVVPSSPTSQKTSGQFSVPNQGEADVHSSSRRLAVHRSAASPEAEAAGESTTASETSGPVTYNPEASSDYRTLIKDIAAGHTASVQTDYSKLQADLRLSQSHAQSGESTATGASQYKATLSAAYDSTGNVLDVTV